MYRYADLLFWGDLMKSVKMFLWMLLVTGIFYPLFITGIGQWLMPEKANGSLLGKKGSRLIAQKFTSERYFWPRPSSIDYNPLPSGGSNLGPISPVLKKVVEERRALYSNKEVPSELLFASASGLDPHISPETASFQIERVAKARGKKKEEIQVLVEQRIERPFWGPPCINVLLLNVALDEAS